MHCSIAFMSFASIYFLNRIRPACLTLGNFIASTSITNKEDSELSGIGRVEQLFASCIDSNALKRDPFTLFSRDLASEILAKSPAPGEERGTATAQNFEAKKVNQTNQLTERFSAIEKLVIDVIWSIGHPHTLV